MIRRPKLRDHSINRLIPNMLTIMALCAGLTGIRQALLGHWELAVLAFLIAAIFDALDGRIARLLDSSSKFGAELDSLSDFVSFGVAPAMIMFLWSTQEVKGFGWALTLAFSACMARRLARFEPVAFDPGIASLVEETARELGLGVRRMTSGAGHDAQMMARICPSGMIFVPSVRGISHNPAEHTEEADLVAGANVLLRAMLRLAAR